MPAQQVKLQTSIKGRKVEVLDGGYLKCLDVMGDDLTIVEAARMSTNAGTKGEEKDKALIRFLLYNKHMSPFEMVEFLWEVRCPMIPTAWHWVRHRMAEYNFLSGRYSVMPDDAYNPKVWRKQSKGNKQVGDEPHPHSDYWSTLLAEHQRKGRELYHAMLDDGISKEMARFAISPTTYTVFRVKMNARSAMNFIDLRDAPDAQEEIRVFAHPMNEMFCEHLPFTACAWNDLRAGVPYKGRKGE